MNNLVFSYPAWYILLCILIGGFFAGLLYFRDTRFSETRGLLTALTVLRFLSVTAISLLLIEPMVRYFDRDIEPPVVVLAVDNSQSLAMGRDSAAVREGYPQMVAELKASLSGNYDVAVYTFGQSIREDGTVDLSEPVTDLSSVFTEVKNRYANRNLGAVVLASDGIYNRGANPRYGLGAVPWKVLPIAMGDTAVRRDAFIAEVGVNRIAYLGNKFPIETTLEARKLDGRDLQFSIVRGGKTLHSANIKVEGNAFRKTLRVLLDADLSGTQKYSLRIAPVDGELTVANNTRDVFVDVIDGRQKILILAGAPHPDINALRSAVSANENYTAEVALLSEFDGNFSPYDLLILHQIPSPDAKSEPFRLDLLKSDVPVMAVVGTQTVVSMLSRYGLGVDLGGRAGSFHDVRAAVATDFSTFTLDEGLPAFLRDAPPLKVHFGQWRKANSADVLLYQRVGSIDTDDPLLIVNRNADRKTAVILGEGLWRWRLYDYATEGSHKRFDGFIGSLVQYLALKADKRFFKVNHERSFMENERIVFNAEVYNDAYEAVNDPEVSIVFKDEDGKDYPFTFSRTASAYRLDAGSLPTGTYSYLASTSRGGEKLEERGSITVKPFDLEGANLTADHGLLQAMADATGGRVFYPENAGEINDYLSENASLSPVSYTTEVFDTVLNLKWIFFVILLLLSAEWFLRKRSGNY